MGEARNSYEELQQVEQHAVDLTLMDVNLPEMDGYTLPARISVRPLHSSPPVLAITANAILLDPERSVAAYCDRCIEKPRDIGSLPQQLTPLRNTTVHGP